jgi:cytoskeleton protein RodZ
VAVAVALLLAGAALLWFVPEGFHLSRWLPSTAPAASSAATPVAAASEAASVAPVAPATALAPAARAASDAEPPQAVEPARLLQIHVNAESWVEVTDGAGQALLSRTLQPGESVDLDGAFPLHVKIGNAGGTELRFRGQPLDLSSATRDNVARLDLK